LKLFYETALGNHGLPHDPVKAIVAPRPIGWISTISADGKPNLAPYSYFNIMSARPALLMFSSDGLKDSVRNIRETGEFVANHAGFHLAEQINITSVAAPRGVDEFHHAGLTKGDCKLVRPPRVAESCAALECKLVQEVTLHDLHGHPIGAYMIIGQIVGVHIDDNMIRDGRFDVRLARPVTRLGYHDYDGPEGYFEMTRPDWRDAVTGNARKV
jgi:flavin reductase (DIM6/NTAB) family NADH-FMN oxidoreductase RutF